ncbi:hypothetical protein NECID01_0440 [Nematocida sp. AWRm77]|nr:hypothetical protein NECID01_0440 [Nematocida sp. AWRm77]
MKDDCFYFMTSLCALKDKCAYRHNEEARRSTKVCTNWKNNMDCTTECPYRHSKYQPKESCYWETRGGCKKPDCPFLHQETRSLAREEQRKEPEQQQQQQKEFVQIKSIDQLTRELSELNNIL